MLFQLPKFKTEIKVSEELQNEMIELVNSVRVRKHLNPLKKRNDLAVIAQKHNEEQIKYNAIFHVSKTTGSVADRLTNNKIRYSSCAENLALGQKGHQTLYQTLNVLHKGLLNSPNHYKNIIGDFDDIGIGVSINNDTMFITQVFTKDIIKIQIKEFQTNLYNEVKKIRSRNGLKEPQFLQIKNLEGCSKRLLNLSSNHYGDYLNSIIKTALNELRSNKISFSEAKIHYYLNTEYLKILTNESVNFLESNNYITIDISQNPENGSFAIIILYIK